MILLGGNKFINTKRAAYVSVVEVGETRTTIFAHTGNDGFEVLVNHDPIQPKDRSGRCRKLAEEIAKASNSNDAYFVARDLTLRML